MRIGHIAVVMMAIGLSGVAPRVLADYVAIVNATDNIFGAGTATLPGGGTSPVGIELSSLSTPGGILTFLSVSGSVSYNIGTGSNFNDPDGIGSVSDLDVSSSGGISGIVNGHAGALVGVFLGPGQPDDPAPTRLQFSDSGSGGTIATSFASLAPELGQTFFIGDGLTGDGTGDRQSFFIPTGATRLYLGFADASNYHGAPGAYGDNAGAFTVTLSAVPEPRSLAMMAMGFALIALRAWHGRHLIAP